MKRARWIVIMVSAALCLGLAGGYFIYVRAQGSSTMTGSPEIGGHTRPACSPSPMSCSESSALGAHYGQLAAVPLDNPGGARASLGLTCERTYAAYKNSRYLPVR